MLAMSEIPSPSGAPEQPAQSETLPYWPEVRSMLFVSQGSGDLQNKLAEALAVISPDQFKMLHAVWHGEDEAHQLKVDAILERALGRIPHRELTENEPDTIRRLGTEYLIEAFAFGAHLQTFSNERQRQELPKKLTDIAISIGERDSYYLQLLEKRSRKEGISGYSLMGASSNSQLLHYAFLADPEDFAKRPFMQVACMAADQFKDAIMQRRFDLLAPYANAGTLGEIRDAFEVHLNAYPEHQGVVGGFMQEFAAMIAEYERLELAEELW